MLDALIGQFLGRYQIVQLLGGGSVGAVFKARDTALQRDVAVKVMHPQFTRQPNFQERFLQEARTAARLDHPGIVRVFDFGQAQSLLYIVMEFIPGQSLRRKLDDLMATSQPLPLPEAIQLARHVSLAISYAHRQGVLHRDIKPGNIMLKPEPAEGLPYRPILTDLGLAKLLAGGPLPLDGMSMRTPSYMSPEQTLGEPTNAQSDVYSLGILLYELATGRLPFAISTLTEAIRYHTKEPPPPPRSLRPELPEAIEQVILTALQKDPARRFPSAAALAEALLAAPRLAQGAGQATVIQASRLPAYEEPPAARRVAISMPTEFEVEPGGSTAVTVTVANQGPVPDRLQLSFVDLPAGWAPEPPPVIRLLPGAEQRVTLTVQPPRAPESRAGSHPFTVRAESLDTPAQSAEAQGCLVINPYIQFAGELKPQTVRAGQAAQVRVENQGNAPQSFVVSWQDRNEELTFEPPQTRLTVPEGQIGVARFRATPRSRRWFGGGKAHTFSSRVAVPGVEAQSQTGQVISGGLIPLWLLPVAGISLLVLCVVLFTLVAKPPTIQNVTVDPPNPPAGQPFSIHWVVQNAQSIELRPLVNDDLDPRSGEYTFRNGLPSATNLTFIARNLFGSKVKLLHIGVIGSATVSPAIPSASPTPTGTTPTGPTPTGTASPTPNTTPTATGTPGPCQATAAYFAAAHNQWSEQLGCANSPAGETFMAAQSFERGVMFWRQDSREIYVLQGNSWQLFSDQWQEGQPESDPALVPPEGRQQPVRGFGKVWREQLGGAGASIGWATGKEQGYTGKRQNFAHGLLLTGPDGRIYALFDDGHWQSK